MKKIFPLLLSLLLNGNSVSFPTQNTTSKKIELVSIYCKKEIIDEKTFIHREDIVNNEKKELWSIDGNNVEFAEYEQAILEAEKNIRKKERQAEETRRKEAQEFKNEAIFALNKKILRLKIETAENILKKFNNHNLSNFLNLDKNKIFSKKEFERLQNTFLPECKKFVYTADKNTDLLELSDMIAKIDTIPDKLNSLFYDTVRNAIGQCDDTKVLKELLEVVSQA